MDVIFTSVQVAKICTVGEAKVREWVEAGLLKAHTTPGKKLRYTPASIRAFLEQQPGMDFALSALEAAIRAKSQLPGLGLRKKKRRGS